MSPDPYSLLGVLSEISSGNMGVVLVLFIYFYEEVFINTLNQLLFFIFSILITLSFSDFVMCFLIFFYIFFNLFIFIFCFIFYFS